MISDKILYRIMMGIIVFVGVVMAYNTYLQFYPFQVLKLNKPTKMVKDTYHPGEALTWSVDVTHYTTGVKATVTREVDCQTVNGKEIVGLPTTNFVTKAGTSQFIQSSFILSVSTPPGICKVLIDGVYQLSPNRNYYFHDETNEFKVTK